MKRSALFAFLALVSVWVHGDPTPPLRAVDKLDLPRYMGQWYEIAKFPNRFQKDCAGDIQAQYALKAEGGVEVANRCRLNSGKIYEVLGLARQLEGPQSAKLEVRFAPAWLSLLPFVWGQYWVIDLDTDYQWSVVSEPTRKYLWILARTPQIDEKTYNGILDRLKAQAFALEKLEVSQDQAPHKNN